MIAVTALRGGSSTGAPVGVLGFQGAEHRRPPEDPLLPAPLARAVATLGLVAFGALHWMALVEPTAGFRAGYAMTLGAATAVALLGARRLHGPARAAALAGVLVAGLVGALLAGGVADEQLRPREWSALASVIGAGIDAAPGARIPYRGLDEAIALVIPLGGTVLAFLGTALALWPRRDGRTGFAGAALLALVTLYAVPAVALVLDAEFLRGALLALLVVAFLRMERLRRRDAPAALGIAAVAAVGALLAAPALDTEDPWWNYEDWAQKTVASHTTVFAWDHDYAGLRWPRDGRELLRIESRQRAYWKADDLDVFDGRQWLRDVVFADGRDPELAYAGIDLRRLARWSFTIRVTVRNLRSRTLPVAGTAEAIEAPGRVAQQVRSGIWAFQRPIRRGDAYRAEVYVPQPSRPDLQRAGTAYPFPLGRYTSVTAIPEYGDSAGRPVRTATPRFFKTAPVLQDHEQEPAGGVLERSDLRRARRLSQRLLARSATPYEYVRAIERHLGQGFRYSETPPAESRTLDGFLFDSRAGFCQHYSGAMALLLRLGGVPARVAVGFAPGSYNRTTEEYVVRDVDAHSWVEAWFPGFGWVVFDPTPIAAPPRSQAGTDAATAGRGDINDAGTTLALPGGPSGTDRARTPWGLLAVGALALIASGLAGRRLWAQRGRPRPGAVDELERALRGAGETVPPGLTLRALERRFAGTPPVSAYLEALRAQRYGLAAGGPTATQRRRLRRALMRGRGPLARARTWLALRPRLH